MIGPIKTRIPPDFKLSLIIVLLAVLGFGLYRYLALGREKAEVEKNLAGTSGELQKQLEENNRLYSELTAEQRRIRALVGEVGQISSTVGVLEKLQKTDPELLQKYSKVYFLNENYFPSELMEIPEEYLFNSDTTEQIHTRVWSRLERLLQDAGEAGLEIRVVSAYRSFGEQSSLKANYRVAYGSGANRFSADQGYSEHQLGTAIDFTTPQIGSSLNGFEKTPEYEWLGQNAYKYGFTLSYPQGNAYYIFEPWHWRFIGVGLADHLYAAGSYFYDLDQREIDKYLVSIFD